MNWLLRLFGLGKKELPPAPIHDIIEPGMVFGADWEPRPPMPTFSIQDVFFEAIQEAHEEAYKAERELLDDAKLHKYVKNVIKAIGLGMNKDAYEFVLIHPHDIKLPNASWEPFCQIMIGLFKTIDLKATNEGTYMKVMKKDVKNAFGGLKKPVLDIDERMRAMLSQGIYR
jgi:hypothetical protein